MVGGGLGVSRLEQHHREFRVGIGVGMGGGKRLFEPLARAGAAVAAFNGAEYGQRVGVRRQVCLSCDRLRMRLVEASTAERYHRGGEPRARLEEGYRRRRRGRPCKQAAQPVLPGGAQHGPRPAQPPGPCGAAAVARSIASCARRQCPAYSQSRNSGK